jgi:hypothetical protein
VLKVAVAAAAAELLRLAGKSVDGAILLNGNNKETLTAGGALPEGPRPSACLLPLPLCKPLALTVVLKTVLSCTSKAPCERDLSERRKRI